MAMFPAPDVDECSNNNGGCEDTCTNTIGSFTCKCTHIGKVLSSDGLTCEGNYGFYYTEIRSGGGRNVAVFADKIGDTLLII